MNFKNLIFIFTITLVFFASCGEKESIIKAHYKEEIILFGSYIAEFDIYLENAGYSKKIAGLVEKLVYDGKSFDDYITDTQTEFIGPVTSDDFPLLTDDEGKTHFYKSFLNESYNIVHHSKRFIVIEYSKYFYQSGAAHGNYWTNYFIIDTAQKKILDINDLMTPVDDDYLKELITKEYDIISFLRTNIWPPDTININSGNIELLWNTYTITPYSDGIIGLVLYEDKYLTGKGRSLQAARKQ